MTCISAMKGFIAAALAIILGTVVLYSNHDDGFDHLTSFQHRELSSRTSLLSYVIDPKVTTLKETGRDHDDHHLTHLLQEIPNNLSWKPVTPTERESWSWANQSLMRCHIGQCRRPAMLWEEQTPEWDGLFVKPDMEDMATMETTLEYLHYFVEQKKMEREGMKHPKKKGQHEAEPIDGCTIWFIGDSTTQDQASGAICALSHLGYRPSRNCNLRNQGLLRGTCDMIHPTAQFCPKTRIKFHWHLLDNRRFYIGRFYERDVVHDSEAGVIVFSYGVHSNTRERFALLMETKFMQFYRGFTSSNRIYHPSRYLFMWREHEPQHFDTVGGTYQGIHTTTCVDAGEQSYDNFRNEEVWKFFEENDLLGKVPIIKAFDAQKPLAMFHYDRDCTHYCYSPWRFDLTWHGVALGLQQHALLQAGESNIVHEVEV